MATLARIMILLGILGIGCSPPPPTPPAIKNQEDSLSYAIGVMLGKNYTEEKVSINPEMMALGLEDQMKRGGLILNDSTINNLIGNLEARLTRQRNQARQRMANTNLAHSRRFLVQNRTESGIQELPSGIQYRVLESGTGAVPRLTNSVRVTYTEALLSGETFEPVTESTGTFSLKEVIPGWADALIQMQPGSRWELYIPPHLAYGEAGLGDRIPPNSLLKFDLTLHEITR